MKSRNKPGESLRCAWARIGGIAWLTVRTAVRSRLFVSLVVILLIVVIGLPMTLKGDGTPAGRVRVLLYYTLGLTGILLGIVTLWTACGAIAQEVEDKHIQLVLSKPVRPSHIWFGKWLGILLLNITLLFMSGSVVFFQLRWYTSSQLSGDEQQRLRATVFVGRRAWQTESDSIEDKVDARCRTIEARDGVQDPAAARSLRDEIRKQVIAENTVVSPGHARTWTLPLPRHRRMTADTPVTLRYRLVSSGHARLTAAGVWRIGTETDPALVEVVAEEMRPGTHELRVPATPLLEHIRAGRTLVIELRNTSTKTSRPLVLDPRQTVQLLITEGPFEGNLFRALLVVLCYTALVAALGLAAGSALSFPVATFAASTALVMSLMVHYLAVSPGDDGGRHEHSHGPAAEPTALQLAGEQIVKHLDAAVDPVLRLAPLGMLSDGILVSWQFVGKAVAILGLGYPSLLWFLSSWLLHRREIALPA